MEASKLNILIVWRSGTALLYIKVQERAQAGPGKAHRRLHLGR